MFTGIIQQIGQIKKVVKNIDSVSALISCELSNTPHIKDGDSIAVNGVCLTMKNIKNDIFEVDFALSTLEKTNLKNLIEGQKVNLEFALRLEDFLGGHLVQGHVQDTAVVKDLKYTANCQILHIELPENLLKYCIPEGSIAIDGVSLTISSIMSNLIEIQIIPHTWQHTIISTYKPDQVVNIEVDFIAKYMEKWLSPWLNRLITKTEQVKDNE